MNNLSAVCETVGAHIENVQETFWDVLYMNILLDKSFVIDVVAVKQPIGSGKSLKVLDYSKDTVVKKSIITIKNKDNLCCGRA